MRRPANGRDAGSSCHRSVDVAPKGQRVEVYLRGGQCLAWISHDRNKVAELVETIQNAWKTDASGSITSAGTPMMHFRVSAVDVVTVRDEQ